MSNAILPPVVPVLETTAALTLCDAGFDAFVSDTDSSCKSGVCVRLKPLDSRVEWRGRADLLAPLGFALSRDNERFVLHAGRPSEDGDTSQLTSFVGALLATAAASRNQLMAA